MSTLPTRDEFERRKTDELDELSRPGLRALQSEHDLADACTEYWQLLADFVVRARDLGVRPIHCEIASHGRPQWITWVEGYPLRGGAVVSAPPLCFATRDRRLVVLPSERVNAVLELSLFVAAIATGAERSPPLVTQQTESGGSWPPIHRLDRAAEILRAHERELAASLLELMR